MTEGYLKNKYEHIWKKYEPNLFPEILNRGFLFQYDNITKVDVLFIGINPSFKDADSSIYGSYKKSEDESHPYFKQFIDIKKRLSEKYKREIDWTHLDILAFRETKQDFIKNSLMKHPLGPAFIMEQIAIAKKLIEYINPKAIVVSNTMARTLMGKDRFQSKKDTEENVWMGYTFDFDPKLGTDTVQINDNDTKTPVFFTSMLSGQRALDNGSKERLIWHIDSVLSK